MTLCDIRETFVNKKNKKSLSFRACTRNKQEKNSTPIDSFDCRGEEPSTVTCLEKVKKKDFGGDCGCSVSANVGGRRKPSAEGRRRKLLASMTVEASIALCLFIFMFASFLSLFGVLRTQVKKAYDMDCALQKICASASVFTDSENIDESQIKEMDFSFAGSGVTTSDDDITLFQTYYERISFFPDAIGRFIIKEQVTRRAWTGRVLTDDEDSDDDDEYVYVTDNASVYHTTTSCSHLKLSIKSVSSSTLATLRNTYGAKYYPCEKCGGGSGTVYITDEGNRYHSDKNCSGLKRTYKKVKKSEINLPACSRCGG